MVTAHVVACQGLRKTFDGRPVVDGLSLRIAAGEIVVLLGPSGCGKTTTLRLIAGFERLDGGRIEIDGQVVADGRRHLPPEERRVGMVFQDYALFPHLSVADNVAFGLARRGGAAQAREMLDFVGLDGLGERMPHELSGGQQQRVALARALAPEPSVLLLDEPFSNLDAARRSAVRMEVKALLKRRAMTAVFVTHDQEEALFLGDAVAIMHDGRLDQVGTPEAIFHRPATRFVADFMGQTDFLPGTATSAGVATPLGALPLDAPPAAGTAVEVAVRPDDVALFADETGDGRVIDRQFLGIAYLYRVALPGDIVVQSWQSHQVDLPAGTAVRVAFWPGHTVSIFHGPHVHRVRVPGDHPSANQNR